MFGASAPGPLAGSGPGSLKTTTPGLARAAAPCQPASLPMLAAMARASSRSASSPPASLSAAAPSASTAPGCRPRYIYYSTVKYMYRLLEYSYMPS